MKVAVLFVAGIAAVARAGTESDLTVKLTLESSPVISLEKPQGDKFVDPWGKPNATVVKKRSWWNSQLFDLPGPGYRKLQQKPENNLTR